MFPASKTKTIRNILDILVDDWKYTGTLNSNSALDILTKTFTDRYLYPQSGRLGKYGEGVCK